MADKHLKRCSTSLVTTEMQIKTIMRYQCLPIGTPKKTAPPSGGKGVEELKLGTAGGKVK